MFSNITVVEKISGNTITGHNEADSSGGWDTQVVHGLTAQELPHGGSQHRPAVSEPGVWRPAAALELYLPPLAPGVGVFPQQVSSAVSKLVSPVAKLVTAVSRSTCS